MNKKTRVKINRDTIRNNKGWKTIETQIEREEKDQRVPRFNQITKI